MYFLDILNEGLRISDLSDVLDRNIEIDTYDSKLSDDMTVVVVFSLKFKDAAEDLSRFIQRGISDILDSDVSLGEDDNGKFKVFVEFYRGEDFPNQLDFVLSSIYGLVDYGDFSIRFYKQKNFIRYSKEKVIEYMAKLPSSAGEMVVKSNK